MLRVCDVPRCGTATDDPQPVTIKLPSRPKLVYDLCIEHRAPFEEFADDVPIIRSRGAMRPVVSVQEVLNAKKRATTRR